MSSKTLRKFSLSSLLSIHIILIKDKIEEFQKVYLAFFRKLKKMQVAKIQLKKK